MLSFLNVKERIVWFKRKIILCSISKSWLSVNETNCNVTLLFLDYVI